MRTDRLMNIHEVARYLGVSVRTVYRLVQRGELRGAKEGSVWRFRREEVEAYVDRVTKRT